MGRARYGTGGHGASDSDVSSGRAGGAIFGNFAGWAWASSGVEHFDERGVPGGGGSEALSRASGAGTAAVAGEEALYLQCVPVRRDDLSRRGLDFEAEHGRAQRGIGNVVCAVRDAGLAASDVAGSGELDGRSRRSVYVLPVGR